MSLDAMKQALEAAAMRHAIEQAERQEPVAWMNDSTPSGVFARHKTGAENFGCTVPLYTAPPQRKPLTEEEIDGIRLATGYAAGLTRFIEIARAIERAHGIGGGE